MWSTFTATPNFPNPKPSQSHPRGARALPAKGRVFFWGGEWRCFPEKESLPGCRTFSLRTVPEAEHDRGGIGVRVIGVDPGMGTLGWAIIDRPATGDFSAVDYGAIITPTGVPLPDRLCQIYDALTDVLRRLQPERATVEKLFFGRNITTAVQVGQARGVVLLSLAQQGIPVLELTPAEVKQSVTGYGRADKQQVGRMVQQLLHLSAMPRPDDVADALAVAISGADHLRFLEWVR